MAATTTRRGAFGLAAGGLATAGLARLGMPARAVAQDAPIVSRGRTKVVVLGSQGGQQITRRTGADARCGTSVLIDVDGVLTILDCGCGSAHRVVEAGYDMSAVRNVVITHYHADHIADLDSIVGFAWSSGRNGVDRERRLDVFGPTGTKAYETGFERAWRISIDDQEGPLAQRPRFEKFAHWHEMKPPQRSQTVFSDEWFDVRAIAVNHGDVPAVGYRIRTPDLDLAFSGDRGPTGDNFGSFARGADVLFHEILATSIVIPTLEGEGQSPSFIEHIVNDHCDPQAVGEVATQAGVGTLVLYHLIPGNVGVTDDAWRAMVSPYYAGTTIVAKDLLVV